MAFEVNNLRALGRNSTTGNYIWFYATLADDLATVLGNGYIDALDHDIALNDLVMIQATDQTALMRVSAIDGTTPFPVTLTGIGAESIFVKNEESDIDSAGGTRPNSNVQDYLRYFAERINLKVQRPTDLGSGGVVLQEGIDTTDPTVRLIKFRRIAEGPGITLDVNDGVITISAESDVPPPDPLEELSNVNFFDGFSDWTTPGSEQPETAWSRADARLNENPALTGSTGPNGGAFPVTLLATEGQFYGYTESSSVAGPWSLESPEFDASVGELELTFNSYHNYGQGNLTDGTLIVQGWNGSAWSQIGPSIVGSVQTDRSSAYSSSSDFGTYNSAGFSNPDFRFRFLFTKGVGDGSFPDFNYDCALDNIAVVGPPDAQVNPPTPSPSPGVFLSLSGEDGVDSYGSKGLALNYPNPEQAHNRVNNTTNPLPFAGSRSLKTEVRKSDNPSFVDTGSASGKRRAEVSGRQGAGLFDNGVEGWVGFALYLPSNPMSNIRGCTVAQLHTFTEEMLQMSVFGGNLQLVSDGPSTNQILPGGNVSLAGRNLLDRWFKVRINFLPSTGSNGFIKIWLDADAEGSPTVDYSGRTGPRGPYFKKGTYWWNAANDGTNSAAIVLHDNIRLADETGTFAGVDPATFVRND